MFDGRHLKKSKTIVKKGDLNPEFDETFAFDVPSQKLGSVYFRVSILHAGKTKEEHRLLGRVYIGPNLDADSHTHWMEMIHTPRKQVTSWHKIQGWIKLTIKTETRSKICNITSLPLFSRIDRYRGYMVIIVWYCVCSVLHWQNNTYWLVGKYWRKYIFLWYLIENVVKCNKILYVHFLTQCALFKAHVSNWYNIYLPDVNDYKCF